MRQLCPTESYFEKFMVPEASLHIENQANAWGKHSKNWGNRNWNPAMYWLSRERKNKETWKGEGEGRWMPVELQPPSDLSLKQPEMQERYMSESPTKLPSLCPPPPFQTPAFNIHDYHYHSTLNTYSEKNGKASSHFPLNFGFLSRGWQKVEMGREGTMAWPRK